MTCTWSLPSLMRQLSLSSTLTTASAHAHWVWSSSPTAAQGMEVRVMSGFACCHALPLFYHFASILLVCVYEPHGRVSGELYRSGEIWESRRCLPQVLSGGRRCIEACAVLAMSLCPSKQPIIDKIQYGLPPSSTSLVFFLFLKRHSAGSEARNAARVLGAPTRHNCRVI